MPKRRSPQTEMDLGLGNPTDAASRTQSNAPAIAAQPARRKRRRKSPTPPVPASADSVIRPRSEGTADIENAAASETNARSPKLALEQAAPSALTGLGVPETRVARLQTPENPATPHETAVVAQTARLALKPAHECTPPPDRDSHTHKHAEAPHDVLPPIIRPNFLAQQPVGAQKTARDPAPDTLSDRPDEAQSQVRRKSPLRLASVDYSVLQQCMHCGLCLPTCPTYDATGRERNSPRGRISLMRAIADNQLDVTREFAEEMYFCLGCLACETACPAGVDYAHLFELARADSEDSGVLESPYRTWVRKFVLKGIFTRPWLLRLLGRGLWFHRVSGLQWMIRRFRLTRFLPGDFRRLEPQTPAAKFLYSDQRICRVEEPVGNAARHRVGLLTGCVQDVLFPEVNRDTATVLLKNRCAVETPRAQHCCGSLHAHNGDLETARQLARRNVDAFDLDRLDAIITNAAGCGSHLKHYDRLLADDPAYRERARKWSSKAKDIHEWLVEIGIDPPARAAGGTCRSVTYHEACHLCHGQKISREPREVLSALPGVELRELPEATWCCGSAGIYNITQPEMSARLLERKLGHVHQTNADVVATANPGCALQLQFGLRSEGRDIAVCHPVSLLAEAYRASDNADSTSASSDDG